MRIALHSHYEPEHYHLPHQGLWFVLMLFVGVLIEIRIFGELISYMSVALGVILYRRLSLRDDAAIAA